jgi:hypothetical protein
MPCRRPLNACSEDPPGSGGTVGYGMPKSETAHANAIASCCEFVEVAHRFGYVCDARRSNARRISRRSSLHPEKMVR